jgi:hypothetical protein
VAQIGETLLIDPPVQRLTTRHAELPPEQVAGAVHGAHARFEQCPIREFVPLLVGGAPARNCRATLGCWPCRPSGQRIWLSVAALSAPPDPDPARGDRRHRCAL